ncbi:hypothetical protein [Anaerostipes sp.]|uniref:hypothetical protein n=1 Tax=Anaerostipes sp. TaxID=1872530 RepID=UPI0025C29200|nr:hypothetical protein [Anaerostipes sp.]MBS7007253.1 hypothetical protein [Anaerostipes sp.]
MNQSLSAIEFLEQEKLLKIKNYGSYDEVSCVRIFLGHQIVFVSLKSVLVFYQPSGCFVPNPFMKQIMDCLHYNQIEIIAYDRGDLCAGRDEYLSILKKAGYPYITNIVLASEFSRKRCDYTFMKKMTRSYNPCGKRYGMISDQMNLYAKLKHLDFVLYQSPEVNPGRYYFSKKQKPPARAFQSFINEYMYNGTEKMTEAYHFGFVYVGFFIYCFVLFLNHYAKKHNLKTICFLKNAETACAWYRRCFPEQKAEILQADEETRENEEFTEFLKKKCQGPGILLADFSEGGRLGRKIQRLSGEPMHIAAAESMFTESAVHRYGKDINLFLDILGFHLYTIEEYRGSFPVWKEQKADLSTHKVLREIAEGSMDFCTGFEQYIGADTELKKSYGKGRSDFMGEMIRYAFDEKLNQKLHKNMIQNITGSKAMKKGFRLMKRIYKKIRKG